MAALAALAVVLVTNAVEDTAEGIASRDALWTSARLLADEVSRDAKAASADDFDTRAEWETDFRARSPRSPSPTTAPGSK